MDALETDYLVIGAGAAGLAITDALLTRTDARLVLVDRRAAPGGHWIDAYPFVRLHQPSTLYGVDSVPFGDDSVDEAGPNAGFATRAGADEIRAYFDHVVQRHFLPTGRVQLLTCSDYVERDGPRVVSRLTGAERAVRVRRRVIDARYLEGTVPATMPPPFEVEDGVRCVTPTELTRLAEVPSRVVLVGGGKTASDACVWLLEQGVPASSIRWIRPREAFWMNRRYQQAGRFLPDFLAGNAAQIEAMAEASSIDEMFARFEAAGLFLRMDPSRPATMVRGGIISERELELARSVTDVVRLGRVRRLERDAAILEGGRVPCEPGAVYVHCAASAFARPPIRPIFEPGRISVQPMLWAFACYQFTLIGVAEAELANDDERNAACRPIPYWDSPPDYLRAYLATMATTTAFAAHPALAAWNRTTRLNPMSGVGPHRDDPRVVAARDRIKRFALAAAENLKRLTHG